MAEPESTAGKYFASLEARDWDALHALLAEDVVYEMPQTRERVVGREPYIRFNQEYPGDWHLRTQRVVTEGRHAAALVDFWIGDDHEPACVWLDFDETGRITRITDFWPVPYVPPTGREHLVERY
ncbi:SnoaL-like domain-containing protein [Glycomyces sambucus]|uniref:SnoaL-like domain-containing protein n=1 Tax=Glycomyces sambucus TaxID=380244 RepID=A0A1G9M8C9_9ACTN|nr:nuclear transport factor 2 family protein [Glycomyces sambucus]SDL70201.1 SnoaL-like domain-containing protein [Glycomyces sambucus]